MVAVNMKSAGGSGNGRQQMNNFVAGLFTEDLATDKDRAERYGEAGTQVIKI